MTKFSHEAKSDALPTARQDDDFGMGGDHLQTDWEINQWAFVETVAWETVVTVYEPRVAAIQQRPFASWRDSYTTTIVSPKTMRPLGYAASKDVYAPSPYPTSMYDDYLEPAVR